MAKQRLAKQPSEAPGEFDEHTPLMRQYLTFKRLAGDCILFFRVGDFYELFWEDAEEVSRTLDLATSVRGASGGRPVRMAGVPWHSLENHLARLIRTGRSAAVVDQIGDPATSKGPVERALSRIITPGSALEESVLDPKSDAVLAAVKIEGDLGCVFWTSSSGDAGARVCKSSELANEVAAVCPSEIICPEGFSMSSGNTRSTSAPLWAFDPSNGARALAKALERLDSSAFESMGDLFYSCAGAALSHLQKCRGGKVPFVRSMTVKRDGESLEMDEAARRALEIDTNQRGGTEGTLLFETDRCATPMGSRLLRSWMRNPVRSPQTMSGRHGAIEELLFDNAKGAVELSEPIGRLSDVERIAARIAAGGAKPRDCSSLRDSIPAINETLALASKMKSPLLLEIGSAPGIPDGCLDLLLRAISKTPSNHLRDGGVIADGYDKELDLLRGLDKNAEGAVLKIEEDERVATGIPNLRIEFHRVHGFQIEVSNGQSDKVPAHYRRRQTLKNAERFTTDELCELEAKVIGAKEGALAREKAIFDDIRAALLAWAPEISAAANSCARLDALCSLAKRAKEGGWTRPEVISQGPARVSVLQARHPVVEAFAPKGEYRPNDASFDSDNRTLLITGPNMGGKSTYMRSVAACIVLAQAGSFVPAQSMSFTPMGRICARVGSGDDIASGRSTFMVEMSEMAYILANADEFTFCAIDEVGRGTSTYDGMSIAWACAEHLHLVNRSLCAFSTHHFELTSMADETPGMSNVHLDADNSSGSIRFSHCVMPGPASKSYGIDVAKLAGLPSKAILTAKKTLDGLLADDFARHHDKPGGATKASEPTTPEDSRPGALEAAITASDPDSMTPREALEFVYAMKKLAKN